MMTKKNYGKLNCVAGAAPTVLVICDSPNPGVWERGMAMNAPHMNLFGKVVEGLALERKDFVFLTPCRPVPPENQSSEKRLGEWITNDRPDFEAAIEDIIAEHDPKMVVAMGKVACRQLAGKSVPITKARGSFTAYGPTGDLPVLPVFSPAHILARPENKDVFESDLRQMKALRDCGWSVESLKDNHETTGYEWCLDLTPLLANPPKTIALDCETVGLEWHKEGFRVLSASITIRPGHALVVPLDIDWWNDTEGHDTRDGTTDHLPTLTPHRRAKLIRQFRELLGNSDVSVVGHNLSFDIHALDTLDVEVVQWYADTMQLAFAVDENMQSKSLADCTRRWVPSLAGYSDIFDANQDKSRMHTVDHSSMLEYAGGDTDATFRLAKTLLPIARDDSRNWQTFTRIQMPSLRAFIDMERNGVLIDKEELRSLEARLAVMGEESYAKLIERVDAKVLRRHEGMWKFSRHDFVRDILFSAKRAGGLGLEPLMFTPSTADLPPEEQVPSTSADHLAFFDNPFVDDLISYQKLAKMRTTYVGQEAKEKVARVKRLKSGGLPKKERDLLEAAGIEVPKSIAVRRRKRVLGTEQVIEAGGSLRYKVDVFGNMDKRITHEPTGFWQYLIGSEKIHPSFLLHSTVTGRTSSRGPNAQNFPKRGELAKMFRKIFVAPPGYVFLESDLSQAELRVAAWMANETEMIQIYQDGGDIHTSTAAAIVGVSTEKLEQGLADDETMLLDVANEWSGSAQFARMFPTLEKRMALTVADYCDYKRFQAKSANFGFLYGMGWRGFKRYAKTDYGIDLTDDEARDMRTTFFRKYPRLLDWHEGMENFVREHGYVRALHGALRRLPSVDSNEDGTQAYAVRQAINSPVQRFASDLGLIAMHRFIRDCPSGLALPNLFIHDANIFAAKEEHAHTVASNLKFYMQSPPLQEWFNLDAPFPILSDVSMGPNLCDMAELKNVEAIEPEWHRSGDPSA